jgi:hypothetical protein
MNPSLETLKMNREEVLRRLTRPFPPQVVATLRISGRDLDHIPHQYVVERLNEVLGNRWSFEVVDEKIITNKPRPPLDEEQKNKSLCPDGKPIGNVVTGEVLVRGRLSIMLPSEDGSRIEESSREQYGTKDLMYAAPRWSKDETGKDKITYSPDPYKERPLQIGQDLKSAASLCLVKCASLFGIGHELYIPSAKIGDRTSKVFGYIIEEIAMLANQMGWGTVEIAEFAAKSLGKELPEKGKEKEFVNTLSMRDYSTLFADIASASADYETSREAQKKEAQAIKSAKNQSEDDIPF